MVVQVALGTQLLSLLSAAYVNVPERYCGWLHEGESVLMSQKPNGS